LGVFQKLFGIKSDTTDKEDPFGVDVAQIYRMNNVKGEGAELCEMALSQRKFIHHGNLPDEKHLISFTCDGITRVGLIEVMTASGVGSALIVCGVYDVGTQGTTALIQSLRECCSG
jgi:hypothetical protein